MCSTVDYTKNAEECLGWAKTAKSPKERVIFLQMARCWLEAATVQVEAISEPNSTLVPSDPI
jgi:hypothetical protein